MHRFDPAECLVTLFAESLVRRGDLDGATAALESFLARNSAASSTVHLALARLAYKQRDWAKARRCLDKSDVGPNDDGAEFMRTHCKLELGELTEPSRATFATADPEAMLEVAYERIFDAFRNDDMARAEKLIQLCRPATNSYVERITRPIEDPSQFTDSAIRQRIANAAEEWSRSAKSRVSNPSVMLPAGLKVLLVFRKYFLGGNQSRDHELTQFMIKSAEALGIQLLYFPSEPFRLVSKITPRQQYEAFDGLIRVINAFKPHLLVFDDLCLLDGPAEYLRRSVYKNVLTDLRSKMGFKIVGYYPDPWMQQSSTAIEYAATFADVIWHQDLPPKNGNAHFVCLPMAYPDELFRPTQPKRGGAVFAGSVYSYNSLRSIWLTLFRTHGVQCSIQLATHIRNASPAGDTADSYASFMSQIPVMINFSARSPSLSIVTGRVWESILGGALLLEEDNDKTRAFFEPFVHYIPFRTIYEVKSYVDFFCRHPDLRGRIASQALAWFRERYSKETVWSTVIRAAFDIGRAETNSAQVP